jgi:microtubule-associated protein-like 6
LEYAHGYRTKDCRNNLKYLSENEVSYHTAALGVIMNIDSSPREQRFFDSHTDDIISMTWSADRRSMFTGEMGAKPAIHQWDASTEKPIKTFKGVKKGVSAIAVCDKYLVASGLDDDHNLFVFDIRTGALMASEKGGRDVIIGMRWVGDSSFVSVGVKHYRLW